MPYTDRIFSDALGHTGNVYYYRLRRISDSLVWNNVTKVLAGLVDWANTVVLMPEEGTDGQFPVVIDDKLPSGVYTLTIYKRAGGAPLNTDPVEYEYTLTNGSIFGF